MVDVLVLCAFCLKPQGFKSLSSIKTMSYTSLYFSLPAKSLLRIYLQLLVWK